MLIQYGRFYHFLPFNGNFILTNKLLLKYIPVAKFVLFDNVRWYTCTFNLSSSIPMEKNGTAT